MTGSMVLLARGESRSSSLPSQSPRSLTSLRFHLVFLAGGEAISGDAIRGGVRLGGDAVGVAMVSGDVRAGASGAAVGLCHALDSGDGSGGTSRLQQR
jgi:hypothetical protein